MPESNDTETIVMNDTETIVMNDTAASTEAAVETPSAPRTRRQWAEELEISLGCMMPDRRPYLESNADEPAPASAQRETCSKW